MLTAITVNSITQIEDIEEGISTNPDTVLKNLVLIFTLEGAKKLLQDINDKPTEDFHFFNSFCQFVLLFSYHYNYPSIPQMSIHFIDFGDNIDNALDRYNILKSLNWEKEHKDKIMNFYLETRRSPIDKAFLVRESPI